MPESSELTLPARRPTADQPLLGQTVLVIEDSRFACEALRLLCLRSGARIRRADSLRAAHRHLRVYRPSVVVADLGLPDGSGLDLIRQLKTARAAGGVIIAISGDDTQRGAALAAGADDFLTKPLTSLAAFQAAILAHLPPEARPGGIRRIEDQTVEPDEIALHDDLIHIDHILREGANRTRLSYAAQFLSGLARSAADGELAEAAESAVREPNAAHAAALRRLIEARIADYAVV